MKNYIKLVNFEINRFSKIYATLIGLTIISQLLGVSIISYGYLSNLKFVMNERLLTTAQFLEEYGHMSYYNVTQTIWVMGPIGLCMATLLIYVFFIWYRDWIGKNTFIYRLLMLPTARLHLFFAKASAIFLMTLGLVAVQLMILPIGSEIIKWIVPIDFRMDMSINSIIETFNYLAILFPNTWIQFLMYYGMGLLAIFILFTVVLCERSFGWKGIILGVLYAFVCMILMIAPEIFHELVNFKYLYPMERFIVKVILYGLTMGVTIWISYYLLNKRITV